MKDLERSRKRCTAEVPTRRLNADGEPIVRPCGTALWQYTAKHRVWAPADYIHKHMRGVFDYLICDEVHEEKSETSARANALGALVASCRKVVAMTGTLIGGKAGHVRSLLFRMSPKSLKAESLSWQDDMEFARRYGRVDTIITEKVSRRRRQPPQPRQEHDQAASRTAGHHAHALRPAPDRQHDLPCLDRRGRESAQLRRAADRG